MTQTHTQPDFTKIAVLGDINGGDKLIEWMLKQGGVNDAGCVGKNAYTYYWIDENGRIRQEPRKPEGYETLTFSEWESQYLDKSIEQGVEWVPKVGDWVEFVWNENSGRFIKPNKPYKITEVGTSTVTVIDEEGEPHNLTISKCRSVADIFSSPIPAPTPKTETIIGYRHKASGKEFEVVMLPSTDKRIVVRNPNGKESWLQIEDWQLPDYEPILKPKEPEVFPLGSGKRLFRVKDGKVETKNCNGGWDDATEAYEQMDKVFNNKFKIGVKEACFRGETFTIDEHNKLTKALKQ